MSILAGIAHPLVCFLIGEKWNFAAIMIIPISFTMMWYPIHAINLNLLQVKGRSDLFLRLEIIKKIIGVLILVVSIPFGLVFMCYTGILSSLLGLVINTHYTGVLIQVGFVMQMRDLSRVLAASLLSFLFTFVTISIFNSVILQLIVGAIIGTFVYGLIIFTFKFEELNYIKDLIKRC